jgi:DNA-binding NarL/FixJ family response regulator
MTEFAIGREAELSTAARFLDALVASPGALVLAGEAGIGKTAVLKQVIAMAKARAYSVLSCRPTQSETALSFAALGDLLSEVPQAIMASLPAPQRRGLQVALLQAEPEEAGRDQRAISAGLLSILTALAAQAPVVVAIDDLRWLDGPSARVLEFALRRLGGIRVGILATMRTPDEDSLPLGLDEALSPDQIDRLDVGPLPAEIVGQLVREQLGGAFPRPGIVQIQQASAGNPLFALEIARSLRDQGGRVPSGGPLPLPRRLGEFVAARIGALSDAAREQLLVASALANPTLDVVQAASLSGSRGGLLEAEQTSMIEIDGGRLHFTHPLLASAVYSSASPERRRALHGRIAEVVTDIEEKARHLALSTPGPDDAVAAVMDAGAERADARGAPGAAAELAEHARTLTSPGRAEDLARRSIASAGFHVASGDRRRARVLLEEVLVTVAPGPVRANAMRLLGEIRYHDDSFPEAARLWMQALDEAGDDPRLRSTLGSHLAYANLTMGHFRTAKPHAWAALELAERLGDPGTVAEALAVTALVDLGRGTSDERLERILALEDPSRRVPVGLRPSLIVASILAWEERLEEAAALFERIHRQLLDRGEESELPFLALPMVWNECWLGRLEAASRLAHQSLETSLQLGDHALLATARATLALVHTYQGKVDEARKESSEATAGFQRAGWTTFTVLSLSALGLLDLSLGDPAAVDRTLRPLVELAPRICAREPLGATFLADEIEALVALGDLQRASTLIDQLEASGRALNRAWARAAGGRCRGLLLAAGGDIEGALAALDAAMEEHARLPMPFEAARTLAVRGQVQRRARERLAAKHSLEQALAIFDSRGAVLWARRVRAELSRLGLRPGPPETLTKTEQRVATLAASGLKNREIAGQLFITAKTVESNLSKIYSKLGVRSRTELAARMADRSVEGTDDPPEASNAS